MKPEGGGHTVEGERLPDNHRTCDPEGLRDGRAEERSPSHISSPSRENAVIPAITDQQGDTGVVCSELQPTFWAVEMETNNLTPWSLQRFCFQRPPSSSPLPSCRPFSPGVEQRKSSSLSASKCFPVPAHNLLLLKMNLSPAAAEEPPPAPAVIRTVTSGDVD
ncbi:unnamed protein product [Pleuronectes platessa]|uniref:Uncharacterized protein n=1 Tax=Pleuronectes platessa TaxID=8262 RepID=A0A9N7Y7C3_PLEPL|nr:unnamed protein product [Pleuronectes platessa]